MPLRTIASPAHCASRPDTLLVMLPGSWSLPEDFEREGFVAAVRDQHFAVDLLLVDAHVGYYAERSIIDRLRADVIAPAQAQGYRHIWLSGISIGGLGAMIYAEAWPNDIEGVVALAPYLGSRQIAQAVRSDGGLAAWKRPEAKPQPDDLDLILWRWLKQRAADPASSPSLFLGYGLSDRFVYNEDVLAAALPPARVFTAEGGHDWPVWKPLWQRMLPTLPLPVDSSCTIP